MKLIAQIIALYLPAVGVLQILVTIGSAILFLKLSGNRVFSSTGRWSKVRKKNREMESNMWAIE